MAAAIKAPPAFDAEGDDYLAWKNDIEVWEVFTDLKEKKRGPAVYLSLTGKAREAVRGINVGDLAKNEGVKTIIEKLDSIYLQDKILLRMQRLKNFMTTSVSVEKNSLNSL